LGKISFNKKEIDGSAVIDPDLNVYNIAISLLKLHYLKRLFKMLSINIQIGFMHIIMKRLPIFYTDRVLPYPIASSLSLSAAFSNSENSNISS
jgi:hypothetical protein